MAIRNFNEAEKQKLIQIISQGSQVLGEVDDLKSGLRDTVKAIAEELELKPGLINKAITVATRPRHSPGKPIVDFFRSRHKTHT